MTAPMEIPNALSGQRLAVVDVEGNGQNPPEIIEIAILIVEGGTVHPDDTRTWLIRPQNPITPIVTRKVHGIKNSDVADCPTWPEVASEIQLALEDRIVVAHNAKVEQNTIGRHLPDWTPPMILDTLRLAKAVWPGLSGYGLDKLIEHGQLDTTAIDAVGYHRASYDTWAAWQLLYRLVNDGGLDWSGLVDAAALPGFAPAAEQEGGLW
ncbi:3'-5' exonuclease [Nocardia terpenica]|uniref:Exonuclease domain-containing protein n=1 Tax=Nocardia terpenica TaxID=455432 RepID=A0A164HWH8_9NOCA|nr:3'-5' exonuclease [Nocardia terpenica]KZM68877.1 hypothetical protein AWN90_13910 [Nocardia terpenica]NQE88075.1 3'-5' exonuclease [Nocardia terpenica]